MGWEQKKTSHNKGRKISKRITTAKTVSSTGLNGKKNALHSLYFLQVHIVQFKVSQHANHSLVVYPIYTTKTVTFPGKISRKVHVLFFVSSDDAVQDFLDFKNLLLSFVNLHARITPSSTTYYVMGARVSWLTFHSVFRQSCLHVRLS